MGGDRRAGVAGLSVVAVEGDVEAAAVAEEFRRRPKVEGVGPFARPGPKAVGEDVALQIAFGPVRGRGGDRLRFDEASRRRQHRHFDPARIALRFAGLDDPERPARARAVLADPHRPAVGTLEGVGGQGAAWDRRIALLVDETHRVRWPRHILAADRAPAAYEAGKERLVLGVCLGGRGEQSTDRCLGLARRSRRHT